MAVWAAQHDRVRVRELVTAARVLLERAKDAGSLTRLDRFVTEIARR
jgi:hypothetical protein